MPGGTPFHHKTSKPFDIFFSGYELRENSFQPNSKKNAVFFVQRVKLVTRLATAAWSLPPAFSADYIFVFITNSNLIFFPKIQKCLLCCDSTDSSLFP
jgi:hypothetical protein